MMTPLITIFAFTVFFLDNFITISGTNKGFFFYYFQKIINKIFIHEHTIIPFFLTYVITTVIRKSIPIIPVEVLIITIMWLMQYAR